MMHIDEFLAADFDALAPATMGRCRMLEGRRLFLAGATGFFGKNLLSLFSFLHATGISFEVAALSRSPRRFLNDHPWARGATWLKWHEGDARNAWPDAGACDLVIHAATDTAEDAHVDKLEVFDGMLAITRQALDFATRHRVARLLLCGSGAQYGAIPAASANGVSENEGIACDSCKASSAYGEGKRAGELLAALHAESRGLAVINTRCFAFVGPGLSMDGHFAIGNFIRDAIEGGSIRLSSSGLARRSYLYGADLAIWLTLLLLEAPAGLAVNVGSDHAVSILELAEAVRRLVNPALSVEPGAASPDGERRFYVPSIAVARRLGLDVYTPLDRAIVRTAHWQAQNGARRGST